MYGCCENASFPLHTVRYSTGRHSAKALRQPHLHGTTHHCIANATTLHLPQYCWACVPLQCRAKSSSLLRGIFHKMLLYCHCPSDAVEWGTSFLETVRRVCSRRRLMSDDSVVLHKIRMLQYVAVPLTTVPRMRLCHFDPLYSAGAFIYRKHRA